MSEQAIRHRGYERDSKGKYSGGSDTPVQMIEFAPGGGSHVVQLARDGETVSGTAYFEPGVDVKNGDDLTVRGERYRTIVNVWDGGGIEVLCVRGRG